MSDTTTDALILSQDRFAWEVTSFEKRSRTIRWYTIMVIVAVFFVAYAIITSNFLFAFLVLLFALIILLTSRQEPTNILVQVGDNGVVIHGKLYLYQDLDSFSIVYQPPAVKVLYIESKGIMTPRLKIALQDQDPVALREHLRAYLQEDLDLRTEYLSDMLARLLKL